MVVQLTCILEIVGSNLASEHIFFFKYQYFLHTRFFLDFSFDSTVTWHSKHASKRDLSKIKCTSSGNSTMVIANGYLLSFILNSMLKASLSGLELT